MSGVGFWELILLFLIGLIVLGPERLPRVANQLGTWLGQARRMSRVLKRQLEDELNLEKDLKIRPQALPGKTVPPGQKAEPLDDTYSPAHPAGSPGTGVATGVDDTAPAEGGDEFADTDVLDKTQVGTDNDARDEAASGGTGKP